MDSEPKSSQSELLERGEEEALRREQLIEESAEREQRVAEESPDERHHRELFTVLNRHIFDFVSTEEEKAEQVGAKKELEHMGDAGVDLLLDGVNNQQLRPYRAVEVLSELNSEKSIQAMEFLLSQEAVMKDSDRSVRTILLKLLPEKDKPSSIPAMVNFTNYILEYLDKLVELRIDLISEKDSRELLLLMHDAQLAIDGLQKFTDREGFRRAEELYKKFNEIREKIDSLRKEQQGKIQEKLKSLFDEPFELNLEQFPQATDEEAAQIEQALSNFQYNGYWWLRDNLDEMRPYESKALPFIYQAIRENRLTGHKAYKLLTAVYSPGEIAPILHHLLLDSARGNRDFFQKDMLNTLVTAGDPASAKIIAEFVRRSAEEALKVEREEDRYNLQANVEWGLRALRNLRHDPRAQEYRKLLAFSYPELCAGYEVLSLPLIERPKTKEQREWAHTKLYIRGSSIFAEVLGRGKSKVHDIDVFITNSDAFATFETMKVANFSNVDDLENILQNEELKKLKTWIEKHGYSGKPINLVRVPESHLRLEETFEGEPKLLLWDQALEGEIDSSRYQPEQLQDYQNGNYIINPQFPERLIPNGTLTRALRLMDLSERFGLEYDETILNQAEHLVRNSKLIMSGIPANRLVERQELNGNPIIDPTFIKVFTDKKLRKGLLRKFPRLGQLAEDISHTGGVEDYIKQKFGDVYLATRGYVYLYDIDLSKSPASLDRQKEFVSQWYAELGSVDANFAGVNKVDEEHDLPKPEGLNQIIDIKRLERAESKRKDKNTFLDKITGRYRLQLESQDTYQQRKKIELFLSIMNLEWPANMDMDKIKVSQTLIRLGVNPRNPVLAQFGGARKEELDLVISAGSKDILQASTDKPWHSCACLKEEGRCDRDPGGTHYSESTYGDIEAGSVVVYLMKGNQYLARRFLRVGMALGTLKPAAAIEKLYGDKQYDEAIKTAILKILKDNDIQTNEPMVTYPFSREYHTYFDSASGETDSGNRFYYTHFKTYIYN